MAGLEDAFLNQEVGDIAEKCYEEIWYEGGVRSWMKKFLNVQNVIKK
jgi:hypothetical protein